MGLRSGPFAIGASLLAPSTYRPTARKRKENSEKPIANVEHPSQLRTPQNPGKLIQTSSLPKRQVLFSFRALNPFPDLMSKHNSLKRKGGATGKRSVMKRFERVKLMKERGQWKAGQSAIGLPKTKAEG
ncbi:MAG: small basic protein (TIGR04137 family) [Paracoccaceae bacterium]|jgi:small basic protein (TIGR04137 family)